MNRTQYVALGAAVLLAAGCIDNSAPGNDREAEPGARAPAAESMAAGAAIQGVATSLLVPQIMTEADAANIPESGAVCRFRMTRVGLPVLVYGSAAVVKLNDKLVTLPGAGAGRYSADGVTATVRPLSDEPTGGDPFAAEFVLWLPGAANELGFHGFSEC